MSVKLIAAKTIAVFQMFLGCLATGFAGSLVSKANTPTAATPGGLVGNGPNAVESVLLYLGLAIIVCGFIEGLMGVKFGWWQTVCGVGVTIFSSVLLKKHSGVDYYLDSPIYFFAFIPMAFGIVVIVTGLMHLLPGISRPPLR
ncbi:MAG: hypothetical protein Q7J73_00405 [Dehalococcoidales bacterium]|nr:hypothetical protein [Dehalococcoidales bacterium]